MTKAASWPPVKFATGVRVSSSPPDPSPPTGTQPVEWQGTSRSSDESSCCALRAPSSPRRVARSRSRAMNVWLARAALRTRGLSAGAFRVLLAHVDACRPSGRTCLAGLEELARACELSPKHVMRLRAQLVEAGHLRKLAGAHPGQRPVYEVLPAVPLPMPAPQDNDIPATLEHVASSGRTAGGDGSRTCDPPYKPQGITPPTPPTTSPPSDPSDG